MGRFHLFRHAMSDIESKVEKILSLFENMGDREYLGEDVTQTEHMMQCALAAKKAGEQDFLVLACLLHDIGHFIGEDDMSGLGVCDHGKVGGDFLRSLGMDERVCYLVEGHVNAK